MDLEKIIRKMMWPNQVIPGQDEYQVSAKDAFPPILAYLQFLALLKS